MPYSDKAFDLGLSSHFLLMYTMLGYDFHINAISEMLRVCKEIRIFPIVDLDANKTELISSVISYFKEKNIVYSRKPARAANKLSDDEDMSAVEEESYAYYRRALETGEHIAYLVYDNGDFVGAGGVSFYQVMPPTIIQQVKRLTL